MLNEHEKDLFEGIERALAEDPKFAAVFDKDPLKRKRRKRHYQEPKQKAETGTEGRKRNWLIRVFLAVGRAFYSFGLWVSTPVRAATRPYRTWYDKQSRVEDAKSGTKEAVQGLSNLRILWGIILFVGIVWYIFAING